MPKLPMLKPIIIRKPSASKKTEAFSVKGDKDDQGEFYEGIGERVSIKDTPEKRFDLTGNKTRKIKKERTLNLQQEEFCKLYATDREFFGNGALSYAKAYGINLERKGAYNLCAASASRMLINANILKRINEYLDIEGFNDENVDRQHLFLINQDADLKTKMAAIKEYNALKKRVDGALVKISVEDIMADNLKKRKEKLEEE